MRREGGNPAGGARQIAAILRNAGCVFADDEARLLLAEAVSDHELSAMVNRRVSGVPLEHVLGWAEFLGTRIVVEPGVFVPRKRTELLVRQAISIIRENVARRLVELCCGSGAVATVITSVCPGVEVHCVDIDAGAVRCARRNVKKGAVYSGNLYDPLPATLRGRVDIVVANAPYVPTDKLHILPPEARLYEPRVALDGGADGTDVQRAIAAGAASWLRRGGYLLIETAAHQSHLTARAFASNGLDAVVVRSEELDATVVVGRTMA